MNHDHPDNGPANSGASRARAPVGDCKLAMGLEGCTLRVFPRQVGAILSLTLPNGEGVCGGMDDLQVDTLVATLRPAEVAAYLRRGAPADRSSVRSGDDTLASALQDAWDANTSLPPIDFTPDEADALAQALLTGLGFARARPGEPWTAGPVPFNPALVQLQVEQAAQLLGATVAEGPIPNLWDVPGVGELTALQMVGLARERMDGSLADVGVPTAASFLGGRERRMRDGPPPVRPAAPYRTAEAAIRYCSCDLAAVEDQGGILYCGTCGLLIGLESNCPTAGMGTTGVGFAEGEGPVICGHAQRSARMGGGVWCDDCGELVT